MKRAALASAVVLALGGCELVIGYEDPIVIPRPADASCTNGVKDGDETGKDCGGPCKPCPDDGGCVSGSDCESKVCKSGTCVAASCADEVQNGDETDRDCGGSCTERCAAEQGCEGDGDCKGGVCVGGVCAATCADGEQNGGETAADCGGPECGKCGIDEGCAAGSDCETGVCKAQTCVSYHVWSKSFGDAQAQGPTALVVDNLGQTYLASGVYGSVDFGDGALTSPSNQAITIAKFDGSGNHIWSSVFGGGQFDGVSGMTVDSSGGLWITGRATKGIDFGGGSLQTGGLGPFIAFVAKFDAGGKHLHSKSFGGVGKAMAPSSLGGVVATGAIGGSADFGCGLMQPQGTNVFLVELGHLGGCNWSNYFESSSTVDAAGVAVDGAYNVVLTGAMTGTIDFGGGPLSTSDDADVDVFVARFDSLGDHLWSKRFGGQDVQQPEGVAVDAAGNSVIAGYFKGEVDFGGGPLVSAGGNDVFVAKFDPAGNLLWSKRFGDAADQTANDVALDSAGNVIVTGSFGGELDLGGGPLTTDAAYQVFVAKFSASGDHLWSRHFGLVGNASGVGVSASAADNAIIAGQLMGQIDFGGAPLTTMGNSDIFLAKLLTP